MAPWLQSGWSPISRKRSPWNSACGATGPNPNGSGAGLGPSAPGPRARTPHEILVRNNGQEVTCIAEILTPADFIGHHGKPPYMEFEPQPCEKLL